MGTRPQIITPKELKLGVLPKETQDAFIACTSFEFLKSIWYLAGGTALALQVGHRESFDLDFFTEEKDFNTLALERVLMSLGKWETTHTERGTLYGLLSGAKASFIAYPFFRPAQPPLQCGTVRILPVDDIMAMKIVAISQRGKKRDFVDLYWYLKTQGASLEDCLERSVAQYPGKNHSLPHFLKSLTFFDDAENDPMPTLHFPADWETIKSYFRREVPIITKQLLGLT
jgi:hypothetical protein